MFLWSSPIIAFYLFLINYLISLKVEQLLNARKRVNQGQPPNLTRKNKELFPFPNPKRKLKNPSNRSLQLIWMSRMMKKLWFYWNRTPFIEIWWEISFASLKKGVSNWPPWNLSLLLKICWKIIMLTSPKSHSSQNLSGNHYNALKKILPLSYRILLRHHQTEKFQCHCSDLMPKLFLKYMPRCANPRNLRILHFCVIKIDLWSKFSNFKHV